MAEFGTGGLGGGENSRSSSEHLTAERFRLISGLRKGHPIVAIGAGGPFVGLVSNYPQHVGFTLLILPLEPDRLGSALVRHSDCVGCESECRATRD
jgi:hypothetical protein